MSGPELSASIIARGVERDAADVEASVRRDLAHLPRSVALERLAWLRRRHRREVGRLEVTNAVLEVLLRGAAAPRRLGRAVESEVVAQGNEAAFGQHDDCPVVP